MQRIASASRTGKAIRSLVMLVVAAAAVASASLAVGASPVAAALPTCFRLAPVDTGHIGPIDIPSAGATPASTNCLMRRGNTSAAVLRLQQNLNVCFNGSPKLVEDGEFGPLTEAALRRTQAALGIAADGVYGPVTRNHMPWWAGGGGCWAVPAV